MDGNYQDSTSRLLKISFTLNGKPVDIEVKPWDTAIAVLRAAVRSEGYQGRLWHW